MYERISFDKGATIISHEAGVVKRIKKVEELQLLKHFFAQNKMAI